MAASSNPFRRRSQGWGVFIYGNHDARGENGSSWWGCSCDVCFASNREFFVPAGTHLSVKLLIVSLNGREKNIYYYFTSDLTLQMPPKQWNCASPAPPACHTSPSYSPPSRTPIFSRLLCGKSSIGSHLRPRPRPSLNFFVIPFSCPKRWDDAPPRKADMSRRHVGDIPSQSANNDVRQGEKMTAGHRGKCQSW
jgi:hypothetical protein